MSGATLTPDAWLREHDMWVPVSGRSLIPRSGHDTVGPLVDSDAAGRYDPARSAVGLRSCIGLAVWIRRGANCARADVDKGVVVS